MAKKIVITSIAIMFLSLFCGICFAADDMKTDLINVGNEVNKSLDKAGQSVKNVTNDVMSGNIINKTENGIRHVGENVRNGVSSTVNTTVGAYNTVRTDAETTLSTNNMMSNTTWMWMIIAVLAVLIISAVWYYVAQNNERKY